MTDTTPERVEAIIARLRQERDDADGLAKSHEEEIEHLQSSIQSLRAEYKLCRERLMVLAGTAVERDGSVAKERERSSALRSAVETVRSRIFYWMIRNHHRGERSYELLGETKERLTEALKTYDTDGSER